jgi:hypothetical protein
MSSGKYAALLLLQSMMLIFDLAVNTAASLLFREKTVLLMLFLYLFRSLIHLSPDFGCKTQTC